MPAGLWRTIVGREPVSRVGYVAAAAVLAIVKYVGDALALAQTVPAPWSPADYLRGLMVPHDAWTRLGATPLVFLLLWGATFLWCAVDISRRRAIDAGVSPWWALAVMVPWLNYVLFGALALLPPRPSATREPLVHSHATALRVRVLALALLLAASGVLAYVMLARRYPASLFVSSPFLIGVAAGWWANADQPRSRGATAAWACVPVLPLALFLLVLGLEGLVCIVMALPLAVPLLVLGSMAGRRLAGDASDDRAVLASLAVLPFLGLVEPVVPREVREVTSVIDVAAPPDVVWTSVIAFPPIEAPAADIFRLGIAMPPSATIEGEGIGAIRRCRFTTGDFVEPITAWEPGRRLAFDVTRQPEPLRELSWRAIAPPHLDVGFRSVRGEFRLIPLADGRTRLEGRTWYELDLQPVAYWALWSDAIVHRVHRRVLEHIAAVSGVRAVTDRRDRETPAP